MRAINNSGGREDIIEAAVCALRHITSRHPNAEIAQNSVRLQNGIPMLTNFLQQQCRWPLMIALLGSSIISVEKVLLTILLQVLLGILL